MNETGMMLGAVDYLAGPPFFSLRTWFIEMADTEIFLLEILLGMLVIFLRSGQLRVE